MENGTFTLLLKDSYPLNDTLQIGRMLTESTALVAGWILPERGLLDLMALAHAMFAEQYRITVLPDRNIVSRMAEVAREGRPKKIDKTSETAIRLMAFSQAVDWGIDPGLAFHELAQMQGNEAAWDELAWFRTADRNKVQHWLDLGLGRTEMVSLGPACSREPHDFAADLKRWTRNYIVTLKIAELELTHLPPIEKFERLLDWMVRDFFVAGPGLIFAARYWAPIGNRAGLIKSLQSPHRQRAIDGCKNAAWDITYLSQFALKIAEGEQIATRYILATCDERLAEIAPFITYGPDRVDDHPSLSDALKHWWGTAADRVAVRILDASAISQSGRIIGEGLCGDTIARLIDQGVRRLLDWSPKF